MKPTFVLRLEPRAKGNSALQQARRSGKIPGVYYTEGASTPVQVEAGPLRQALGHGAEHHPITVKLGAAGKPELVMIKGLQRDLLTQAPAHVDFMPIATDKSITADLPLRFHGEHDLKSKGLLLHVQLHGLTVEAKPEELPELIDVNVGHLKSGAVLTVGDLKIPEGCAVQHKPGQIICSVGHTRVRTEEEAQAKVPVGATTGA